MNVSWKDLCMSRLSQGAVVLLGAALCTAACRGAEDKKPAGDEAADVLVLSNGDTLHGKLVKEAGGKVTFHTEPLGDVDVSWDHIKELHATGTFGVVAKNVKLERKEAAAQIPTGSIAVTNGAITVQGEHAPATPIPVKDVPYVVDGATLHKEIDHHPGFFAAWNGAATAGATVVKATQNQYTVSGGLGLVRVVPTVSWLNPRNRMQVDFSGSYGKITEPGTTPVKSAIYHVDGERDEYFAPRLFALVQTAFDHNFSQDLQLQQIYGGGLGVTLFTTPRQEADVKGTLQYERQKFISTPDRTEDLIGSTIAVSYILHQKAFTWTQTLSYIPSYNTPRAYSANETDTLAIPAYKNLAFSVGTIDTYLNNPPESTPPTKRNSFQFTMGLTYAIKSKY